MADSDENSTDATEQVSEVSADYDPARWENIAAWVHWCENNGYEPDLDIRTIAVNPSDESAPLFFECPECFALCAPDRIEEHVHRIHNWTLTVR